MIENGQFPGIRGARRALPSLGAVALLAGCVSFPADRLARCAKQPQITEVGGVRSTTLTVLTYNVEGLPWPARSNRGPRLREIGRQLAGMRANGTAPDVVLLQEAFSKGAVRIATRSGYANFVAGPEAGMKRPPTSAAAERELTAKRFRRKGEGFPQIMPSGLYILSDYPIVRHSKQPFPRRTCAGFDCLANKGLLHARIVVPQVPSPIDLFNTHLNSRGSTGVSEDRSLLAHRLQIDETARFIEGRRDGQSPLIFGGDFNMQNAPDRFERFELRASWPIVHQYCAEPAAGCDVRLSWDGDAPWMDTQDLQGFDSGPVVQMRPTRVQAMFDRAWRGKPLADHDGLLVEYKLSWPASAPHLEGSAAPRCVRPA